MAKQIKVREDNYFAVQGWMVTELKLKGNALMLYAIIYGFSQTTNTAFTGSVDYLCEWLGGVSRPTVINTLDNLVKQGLLTKSKRRVDFISALHLRQDLQLLEPFTIITVSYRIRSISQRLRAVFMIQMLKSILQRMSR